MPADSFAQLITGRTSSPKRLGRPLAASGPRTIGRESQELAIHSGSPGLEARPPAELTGSVPGVGRRRAARGVMGSSAGAGVWQTPRSRRGWRARVGLGPCGVANATLDPVALGDCGVGNIAKRDGGVGPAVRRGLAGGTEVGTQPAGEKYRDTISYYDT